VAAEAKQARGQDLLHEWLEWGADELEFLGEREARRECELVLEHLLGVSRAELYLKKDLKPSLFSRFSERIRARRKRRPLAYVLGKAYFWENELAVGEGVFIPRPETESLIEAFLDSAEYSRKGEFRFLDLGTGSGNIAVTLAKLFPRSRGVASDLSWKALIVARCNAEDSGVEGQLDFLRAEEICAFGKAAFDVIFSNPPYVSSEDIESLEPEVRKEPRLALEGGKRGLDFYKKILRGLGCLKRGGSLWLEMGWNQAEAVNSLFGNLFSETKVSKDLEGKERIFSGIGFHG